MARTINFDFAQGGGSTITSGRVFLSPAEMRQAGSTIILPSSDMAEIVGGLASIEDVEPSSTAGWYQVRVEADDRRTHTWMVQVPDGTSPVTFSLSWADEAWTLPLAATGVQVQQWIQSVRSHAFAANANALNALDSAASAHTRIDGLEVGGIDPGAVLPVGGSTGQVLAKSSGSDFAVEWVNQSGGGGSIDGEGARLVLKSEDMTLPVLEIHAKLGDPHITSNANLTEWRNTFPAFNEPTQGQLVSYINEEGFLRIQNQLHNKTMVRLRNLGTATNAIQVVDSGNVNILFNVDGVTGEVTAPNIGLPVRAILGVGEQPAPGMPEGIYLRRTS